MGSLAGKSPANTYKSLLKVERANGDDLLTVDTNNSLVKVGTSQVSATTQLLTFSAYRLIPGSTSQHMFVPVHGMAEFGTNQAHEINGGTGTDPNTSLDKGTTTDELVNMLFNVPFNMTIDAVKVFASTDQDTDCTLNYHLMSYDMTADGTTNDGNLSNGTVLADGQATSVDRNVIKSIDMTIQSSSVTSGKVIACFVENETNTDDINIQVQVKYHIA